MVNVFIVFSPRPTSYLAVESIVMQFAKTLTDKVLLVKENGKSGDHPHLNLVYNDKSVTHIQNIYRKIKPLFTKAMHEENKRLVHIKEVYDMHTLVRGYLQKESDATVLYTHGKSITPKVRNNLLDELLFEVRQYPKDPPLTLEQIIDQLRSQ